MLADKSHFVHFLSVFLSLNFKLIPVSGQIRPITVVLYVGPEYNLQKMATDRHLPLLMLIPDKGLWIKY